MSAERKTIMKKKLLRSFRCPIAAGGLFLGLALVLGGPAGAQELLKNGNFEAPFPGTDPSTNWTLVFVGCDIGDFGIAGQSTEASTAKGGRGAQLRANNWNSVHGYFRQVVTNLTAGASYTLTIQKMKAAFQNYVDNGKLRVYACMISDTTSNVVSGDGTIVGPYSLVIAAGSSRQIEVQLHVAKSAFPGDAADDFKSSKSSGWFDDCSLTLTP
jgi:hypothetical protein